MTGYRSVTGRAGKGCAAALTFALAVAALPGNALAQAEVTKFDFNFTFDSACAGELIDISGTAFFVQRSNSTRPAPEHANWSHALGVGQTTGNIYHVASNVNYQVGPDEFMHHLTVVGPGVTFTLQRLHGATFQGPWEVIQEHCN